MATHSCILAWRIPWTEEPGGLQSRGSQRVGYERLTPSLSPGGQDTVKVEKGLFLSVGLSLPVCHQT